MIGWNKEEIFRLFPNIEILYVKEEKSTYFTFAWFKFIAEFQIEF